MTKEEYEQKHYEAWCEYTDMLHRNLDARYVFDKIFDRAFALGKQAKDSDTSLWQRLTDDEKREIQCRYHTNECVLRDHKKRTGDKAQSKAVARIKLLENLFGEENLKKQNNG